MKEWWLQDMDTWYRQESLVLGIGMAAVLAPPPVTAKLLSGTVEDWRWTRTHRCVRARRRRGKETRELFIWGEQNSLASIESKGTLGLDAT